MVAFNCTRRSRKNAVAPAGPAVETLVAHGGGSPLDSVFCAGASYRAERGVDVRRSADGTIVKIRIGRWRTLTASSSRRLAEVRELSVQRVAVRIERFADGGPQPTSEIWQLYDLEGRLEASLQTTPDGKFGMLTNYRTRYASRLAANAQGQLRPVETWKI